MLWSNNFYIKLINYKHKIFNILLILKAKMKRIVRFGKRKFRCILKKVRVKGKQERYTEKVFCREIRK